MQQVCDIFLGYDAPYLFGLSGSNVEIRLVEYSRKLVQTLQCSHKPKILSLAGPGHMFVASTNFVWFLSRVLPSIQINDLLLEKDFQLALALTVSNFLLGYFNVPNKISKG